mmetsp:Transcript_11187/g.28044  ORF Transcript_11187/g.28044 Transcript_11187/m.28044 type:complete len:293 (+) Transcript_11187:809-1687(+)
MAAVYELMHLTIETDDEVDHSAVDLNRAGCQVATHTIGANVDHTIADEHTILVEGLTVRNLRLQVRGQGAKQFTHQRPSGERAFADVVARTTGVQDVLHLGGKQHASHQEHEHLLLEASHVPGREDSFQTRDPSHALLFAFSGLPRQTHPLLNLPAKLLRQTLELSLSPPVLLRISAASVPRGPWAAFFLGLPLLTNLLVFDLLLHSIKLALLRHKLDGVNQVLEIRLVCPELPVAVLSAVAAAASTSRERAAAGNLCCYLTETLHAARITAALSHQERTQHIIPFAQELGA